MYCFGQEKRAYGNAIVGYPKPLMDLACEIAEKFGETPNHCIIVRYIDGKEHHIPCILISRRVQVVVGLRISVLTPTSTTLSSSKRGTGESLLRIVNFRLRYREGMERMMSRQKAIKDEKDRLASEKAKAVHDKWVKAKPKKEFEHVVKNMETSVWLKMIIDHMNVLKAQAIADEIPWSEVVNGASEDEVDDDVYIDGDEKRENPRLSDVEEDQDEWYYTWEDGTPLTREEFDASTMDSEIVFNGKTYAINEEGKMVLKNE